MDRTGRSAVRAGEFAARARSRLAGHPVRPLHPDGRAFTAEVTVWGPTGPRPDGWHAGRPACRPWGAAVLDVPGRHRAVVRVSRGAGTPDGWPDVLGLAIRVELTTGPFDLLLSTSARPVGARHLPVPRRTFTATYGSVLSYLPARVPALPARVPAHPPTTEPGRPARGGPRVLLAALPVAGVTDLGTTLDGVAAAAGRPAGRMLLAVATRAGRWRPFGMLALVALLPADSGAALAFDPTLRHPPDLRPVGLLQQLRGAVYAGARRGRGASLPRPEAARTGTPGSGPAG